MKINKKNNLGEGWFPPFLFLSLGMFKKKYRYDKGPLPQRDHTDQGIVMVILLVVFALLNALVPHGFWNGVISVTFVLLMAAVWSTIKIGKED